MKEEKILFAIMVEEGFPKDGGPIAVMLLEHDEGRTYVRKLRELSQRQATLSETEAEAVRHSAHSFVALLRPHIHKEDNILYPMARSQLSLDAMKQVEEKCQQAESAVAREKLRLVGIAKELEQKYLGR